MNENNLTEEEKKILSDLKFLIEIRKMENEHISGSSLASLQLISIERKVHLCDKLSFQLIVKLGGEVSDSGIPEYPFRASIEIDGFDVFSIRTEVA